MRKEYASLRRRPLMAPVWILAMIGAGVLAIGGWAVVQASTTLVVVMRHAEKAADPGPDPPLSPAGLERAGRVAAMFGSAPKGLGIDAVFVTQWQRTLATARGLTTRAAIPVITLRDDDLDGLRARILGEYRGRRVLVVAHADTVGAIVNKLAHGADAPTIGEVDYGTAYVIAIPRWSRPVVLAVSLP